MFSPDYLRQPPAWFSSRILVGPGAYLTPAFMHKHKVTHVINCAHDVFSPEWWRKSYPTRYVALYAIDSLEHNILDWFPAFERVILQFLREGSGVVYVHCHAGMNRSGFLALAYVCKHYMMPLEAMVSAVRMQRPCILQNPVFMDRVKTFIYGHLSGEKDTRLIDIQLDNGNPGLSAPDHRAGPQRLDVDTGSIESGTGRASDDDFKHVCTE